MRINRGRIPRYKVYLRNFYGVFNELVWSAFGNDWLAASGVEGHGTLCGMAAAASDVGAAAARDAEHRGARTVSRSGRKAIVVKKSDGNSFRTSQRLDSSQIVQQRRI
jgi:hypothetical protein